jgi:hypothetical protein
MSEDKIARAEAQIRTTATVGKHHHSGRSLPMWERAVIRLSVDATTGCWVWQGARTDEGYGSLGIHDTTRTVRVHRWMYEQLVGPIPRGLVIDHLCRNRACANPRHLEPVTRRINTLRGEGPSARSAARSHCDAGHPLTGENVYIRPGTTARICRICRREYMRAYKVNRRAQRKASP